MRLIGLLVTLGLIGLLVWYLLGDSGRQTAKQAVDRQMDDAKRYVGDVEKTVGQEPMERLRKEERDEMNRILKDRTEER